jgi:uncharacterized protein YjbI with pentapeptide repeats
MKMEEEASELIELRKRLDEQEAKLNEQGNQLIEQEHRPFKVFKNFFITRKKWPKGDKRRTASAKALLYSIFFSPTTVAATGGTVAIISLFILYAQTQEMRRQNDAIVKQNGLILKQNTQQNDQFVNQRLTELTRILYDTTDNKSTRRLKSEGLVEYIELKRQKFKGEKVDIKGAHLRGITLYNYRLDSIDFTGSDFTKAKFDSVSMKYCDLSSADFNEVQLKSVTLEHSILKSIFFTHTSFVSVFMDSCDLTRAKFKWVVAVNNTFKSCKLKTATFDNVYLSKILFDSCNLKRATFNPKRKTGDSHLNSINFGYSNLTYCRFSNTTMENNDFIGATLTGAWIDSTEMYWNKNIPADSLCNMLGWPTSYVTRDSSEIEKIINTCGYNRTIRVPRKRTRGTKGEMSAISKAKFDEIHRVEIPEHEQ